jgi:hypothetical protein
MSIGARGSAPRGKGIVMSAGTQGTWEVRASDGGGFPPSRFYVHEDEARTAARTSALLNGRDEDYLMVIYRDDRAPHYCRFCGGQAESAAVDYCRDCYYCGATQAKHEDILTALGSLPTAKGLASIWHTGGGCWGYGVLLEGGLDVLTSDEASVDNPPSVDRPWIIALSNEDGEGVQDEAGITCAADVAPIVASLMARWERGERDY